MLSDSEAELKKYTFAIYILQAFGFVLPFTPIIGVIINYVKAEDVSGSWLETHFRWQKRTFWFGLLWIVVGSFLTGIMIGYLVLGILTIWFMYRIAKGWIYLADGKVIGN